MERVLFFGVICMIGLYGAECAFPNIWARQDPEIHMNVVRNTMIDFNLTSLSMVFH